jgi:hypothetical protein
MDARDRFHLARAQAHLAAGDSSRAARHVNKCAFGDIRKVPDVRKAPNVVRPINWPEKLANETPAEKEEKFARGERMAEQRAAYDETLRVFERTGFGDERAAYSTACDAAAAFRKIPDAELASRQKAGDKVKAKPWETFRQEIIDARAAGDFNKVFDLAVRQEDFWNASDLGEGFKCLGSGPKSIAKLIVTSD